MNYIIFPKPNGWFALIRLYIVPWLDQPSSRNESWRSHNADGNQSVKYTMSVTLLIVSHHIYSVYQIVWYHVHKWSGSPSMRQRWWAGESGSREWDGQKKTLKRFSVYWCTSFSSQQEFFPCSIITARLPTHKRPRREVESPPDVISSTFTHNHGTTRFQMWWARPCAVDGPHTVNICYVNRPKKWI